MKVKCVDCSTLKEFDKDLIRCKDCQKPYLKNLRLLSRYGITLEEYENLFIVQHGCCAICRVRKPAHEFKVDHCHETGKVRGLLCLNCNVLLGHAKDNPRILLDAVKYLNKEHSESLS